MDEVGKHVWVQSQKEEDEEVYKNATIVSVSGNNITIQTEDGQQRKVTKDQVFYPNPPILEGTDDLTALSRLHEPAVLHNLKTRYTRNQIYSKSGPILIAVNPYQSLPLYSDALLRAYCSESVRQMPPHVYAIGDQAFRAMTMYQKNQSVLVTGESGAGKTETTKILLQYFAAKGKKQDQSNIEDKVLGSTPILEAFGNAKTLRNDNSSRFGKFILVDFDDTGSIIGARLKTYLLEKSRLIFQSVGERNYHVFYELCAAVAADSEVLPSAKKWDLKPAEEYHYLKCGGDLDIGRDEVKYFGKTKKALEIIGMTVNEIDDICTLLASILSLGNIRFYNNNQDAAMIEDSAKSYLSKTAELLGCDEKGLQLCLTTKNIVTGKDTVVSPLDKSGAEIARDSLAMLLYENMFLWLVDRINTSMKSKDESKSFIGILDIYGFESFKVNSFEQFCINYANEKLQQQFNQFMFKLEQEEYEKEQIDWKYIKFTDNQPCIHLIEKNLGILSILDEETRFPKATGETLATKLLGKIKKHPFFEKAKFHNHGFILRHYPGEVEYDTTHFLDKNRNAAQAEYLNLLKASTNKFVKLVVSKMEPTSIEKGVTVSSQFRDSLTQLMDIIKETEPNYIRCIKPNNTKKPHIFGQKQILEQLRCNGVLEAIRIAIEGYPTRYLYSTFFLRFRVLSDITEWGSLSSPDAYKDAVRKLVENITKLIKLEGIQYGKTKLFLKGGQLASLEELRTERRNKAVIIMQKYIRGLIQATKFTKLRYTAFLYQSLVRRRIAIDIADKYRRTRASTILQSAIRGWKVRCEFSLTLEKQHAILVIQCAIRRKLVMESYQKQRRKIICVQARWRGILQRFRFGRMKEESKKAANLMSQNVALQDQILILQAELESKSKIAQSVDTAKTTQLEAEKKTLENKVDKLMEEIQQKSEEIAKLQQGDIKLTSKLAASAQKQKETEKTVSLLQTEIEEHKTKISELNANIQQLNTEITKSQQANALLNETIKKVQAEAVAAGEKSEKVKILEGEIAEKNRTISSLTAELESLNVSHQSQLSESQRDYSSQKTLVNNLKNQLAEETKLLSDAQAAKEELEKQLVESKRQLEQLKQNFSDEKAYLTTKNAQQETQLEERSVAVTSLQTENLKLKNSVEETKDSFEKMKQDVSREKRQNEDKISQLNRELQELAEQTEEFQKRKSKLTEANQEMQNKLQEEHRRYATEEQRLNQQLSDKSSEVETLRAENLAISTARNNIRKELDELASKLALEKLNTDDSQKAIKELQNTKAEEIETWSNKHKQAEEEARLWKQKFTGLKDSLELANPHIEGKDFGERLKKLETEVTEKDNALYKVKMEKDQFATKIKSLSTEISNLTSNATTLTTKHEEELRNLKLDITQKNEVVNRLELRVEQMQIIEKGRLQDVDDLRQQLTKEKSKSQEKVDALQTQLDEVTDKLTTIQLEHQKLITRNFQESSVQSEVHEEDLVNLQKEIGQLKADLTSANQKTAEIQLEKVQLENSFHQKHDKLSFESQHEKMLSDKKIKQLETQLEEAERELTSARQENRRLGSSAKTSTQLHEEAKINLEAERKQHKSILEKFNQLKREKEEALTGQEKCIQQLREQAEILRMWKERYETLKQQQTQIQEDKLPALTKNSNPKLQIPQNTEPKSEATLSPRSAELPRSSVTKKKTDKRESSTASTDKRVGSSSSATPSGLTAAEKPRGQRRATGHKAKRSDHMGLIKLSAFGDSSEEELPDDHHAASSSDSAFDMVKNFFSPSASSLNKSSTTKNRKSSFMNVQRKKKEDEPEPKSQTVNAKQGNFPLKNQSQVLPEKTIAESLSKISHVRAIQFRTLSETLLSLDFQDRIITEPDTVTIPTISGIPISSFVLLRYMIYIQQLDNQFFKSEELQCLPAIIRYNMENTESAVTLVPYLNNTAVLFTVISSLLGPPSTSSISLNVQWTQITRVDILNPESFTVSLQDQLQFLFGLIYGKILTKLMKVIHQTLTLNLLSPTPSKNAANDVVDSLIEYLNFFQLNCMEPSLVQQFFGDCFNLMDATIFNEIILRKDLCTFSAAFQLKMSLEEILQSLEEKAGQMVLGTRENWFPHTTQIINCLTLDKKLLCQAGIRKQVCPNLSLAQLKEMCTLYQCEEFENAILGEVVTTLMSDPDYNSQDSLLINLNGVTIPTKKVHYVEAVELVNLGFVHEIVDIVVGELNRVHTNY